MTSTPAVIDPAVADSPRQVPPGRSRSVGTALVVEEPVSYGAAWDLQSRLHAERVHRARPDTLLILEHRPVYTLGRTTQPLHWGGYEPALRAQGAEVHRVNRGGSITYHGPGQVVAYPIFELAPYAAGPRQLVHHLEDVVLRVLRRWRIDGHRVPKRPGIWVAVPDERKIASIGLRVEHGVTLHGLALNVDMDLTPFERIVPCGLKGCRVTSMAEVLHRPVSIESVKEELAQAIARVLSIDWTRATNVMSFGESVPFRSFVV